MTKVARLFEEEKIAAANEAVKKLELKIAKSLLEENIDISIIIRATGLSKETILELEKEKQQN